MQDRRVLIPIGAAIVLTVVCAVRLGTDKRQNYADQVAVAVVMRPATRFEALDSNNHLFRLGTYLGRHKIIVVFFDGETGAELQQESAPQQPPVEADRIRRQLADLIRLRERFGELQQHDVKVVAVSATIPQRNRASMQYVGDLPFPLVSDFDPTSPEGALRIHRQWGRFDDSSGKPNTGIFLIDRKGQVRFGVDGPKPVETIDQAIDAATK